MSAIFDFPPTLCNEPELAPPDELLAQYFARESAKAAAFGAGHVARVLGSCAGAIPLAPRIDSLIRQWPADLAASGVAFRLNAGLHMLVRTDRAASLQHLAERFENALPGSPIEYDIAVAEALAGHEDELMCWLARPTQTNEVGRLAGLMGVLSELNARRALQTELLELGSSAGLNLNLAHYNYELADKRLGNGASPVRIAPVWRGRSVAQAQVSIVAARGVDLAPLDVARSDDRERLYAYTWPGMTDRMTRLRGAIAIAEMHPPMVDRGSAGGWLQAQLSRPQAEGVRRVVFHSMVMQYVPQAERDIVAEALVKAGAQATPDRPLVRVGLEWCDDRREVELLVTVWEGSEQNGRSWRVATCHPYAEWFDWRGIT